MSERHIDIRVPALNRVEGEGALDLVVHDGRIAELAFRIFEPPRLFERLLQEREYHEVPDITARICGICPVAYQMSAARAIEAAFAVPISPWIAAMRRALYCGEWIQSHALHIHLLALPDFLGFDSSLEMAATHGAELRRGMALQRLGNDLIALFGGRSVHPVGAAVGGFHHAPASADVEALRQRLVAAIPTAEALVRWLARIEVPDDAQDFTSLSLRHPDEYPMIADRVITDTGREFTVEAFEEHVTETQVPHSTALYAHLDGKPYLVGPLARLNLNRDRVPAPVATLLAELGEPFPSRNMFHSLLARGVEILIALHEAERLLRDYRPAATPRSPVTPRASTGRGASEAPRGILFHRYAFDADGLVRNARLVPPTSQNQARIEQDLKRSLEALGLDRDADVLRRHAETVIRNYDPCISCATHFLRLRIARRAD